MQKRSSTYTALIELLLRTEREATDNNLYSITTNNGIFERVRITNKTKRLAQAIVITDNQLFNKCSPAAWYLVGMICSQLKRYNALWHCTKDIKKNSTHRRAIKELIENKILVKTETIDMYIVNPFHIRRGEFFTVISTTAKAIEKCHKISTVHFINKNPIDKLDYTRLGNEFISIDVNKQIGYTHTNEIEYIDGIEETD